MSKKVFKRNNGLISAGLNAKTVKGDKAGEYATAIMYLAPHTMAGGMTVCAMALMAKCVDGCLVHSGRAEMFSTINEARIRKTKRYLADRAKFMADLVSDIEAFIRWCAKHGVKPAVRLNGTSDIQWEVAHPCVRQGQRYASIFEAFPEVQFYDYTKIYKRAYRQLPSNYALTLSYSAANEAYAEAVVKAAHDTGCNVAVVYRSKSLRDSRTVQPDTIGALGGTWLQREVIDGDQTDMRFLDPKGVIVGLYAKGKAAKRDTTGFVVG